MATRRKPRPMPSGMATVQAVMQLGSGMRLRYSSRVGETEAQALWGTLIENAGKGSEPRPGVEAPVKP